MVEKKWKWGRGSPGIELPIMAIPHQEFSEMNMTMTRVLHDNDIKSIILVTSWATAAMAIEN